MIWRARNTVHDFASGGKIMGIVNVTTDSFSDGGEFFTPERAIEHGLRLAREGAEILDIGGESTRPGAEPVPAEEELRRVLPVVRELAAAGVAAVSIDTSKAAVARAALDAGATIVNDVTGLRGDPAMAECVREMGAAVVIMHMQGTPRDMQRAPHYEDVVREVREFFEERLEFALAAGISLDQVAWDPGIGFGKSVQHNLELIAGIDRLRVADRPMALGVSRKSFIGRVTGAAEMEDRLWGTVALTSYAREKGANIFRVHDVEANRHAMQMTEAILTPMNSAQ
jgi:dihydropteroate synthase